MPGITGQATTYNTPNFVGDLFEVSPSDTPFLSAVGGLTGGLDCKATEFEWSTYDLRDASQRTRKEGQDASDADTRVRSGITNVVQIHQELIDVSYSKQAAINLLGGAKLAGENAVKSELAFQINAQLKSVARDVEYSFIQGNYQKPTDNTAARKTKGIIEAITTNVITNAADTAITEKMVLDLLQKVWDAGGIHESETATLMVNSTLKRALTKIFVDPKLQSQDRKVGGANLQTIETDFGRLNIMLNRYVPVKTLLVVSLEQCAPVFLDIPGKGHFFVEPLAKTGAADKHQLYGEIGLKFGNEKAHGKITNLISA